MSEVPTPKDDVQELTRERKDAQSDGTIDENEKQKLSAIAARIRDFEGGGENAEETAKRKDSLEHAIHDVSMQEKIPEIDICRAIWFEEMTQIDELGNRGLFQKWESVKDSVPDFVLRTALLNTARRYPAVALEEYNNYKTEFFSDDVLEAAAKSAPNQTKRFACCEDVFALAESIADKSYASEVFLAAARGLKDDPSRIVSTIMNGFANANLSTKFYAPDLVAFCADTDMETTLVYSKFFKNNKECMRIVTEKSVRYVETQASANPVEALTLVNRNRIPISSALLRTLVENVTQKEPLSAIKAFELYRNEPYAEKTLRDCAVNIAPKDIDYAIDICAQFGDMPSVLTILEDFGKKSPNGIMHSDTLKEKPYGKIIRESAQNILEIADAFQNEKDPATREKILYEKAQKLNPHFPDALRALNQETGILLELKGVRKDPLEFVFVNTFEGKSVIPVRIGLNYFDMEASVSPEKILQLLRKKMQEELTSNQKKRGASSDSIDRELRKGSSPAEQNDIWKKGLAFDLPKNKTSVMLVGVPKGLKGVEEDFAYLATEIYQKRYGATITNVAMEKEKNWKEVTKDMRMPESVPPTVEGVLKGVRSSLEGAVAAGQSAFVLHYMAHGGGKDEKGFIEAADGQIDPKKIAEALMKPDKDGIPLCAKIDITIIAETCYSGNQLKSIAESLKTAKVPVKNLHIITEADDSESDGSFTMKRASLVNDAKRNQNGGGAFDYYMSYYFQMIDAQRARGVTTAEPVGTFGHAVQFADRMSREEAGYSSGSQDLQGYQYSTKDNIDMFFSSLDRPKSNAAA